MARPHKADSERTRTEIIAAATSLFGEVGFQAATIRSIADRVGITFATVHHYYGTKKRLYEECLAQAYASMMKDSPPVLAALSDNVLSLQARVENAVRLAFQSASSNRARSRFLMRAAVFDESVGATVLPGLQTNYADVATDAIAKLLSHPAPHRLRFGLIGIGFLLVRFGAVSAETIAMPGTTAARTQAAEDYIVEVALATLLPK